MTDLRWVPFRRGTDGLTRRQRARYARTYAEGPGKTPAPSVARTARLRAAAGVSLYPHRGGIDCQPGKGKPCSGS